MEKYDYKRYQMKDIASLERRIQRMEEAVTLNMLEQNAINVEVKDAVTGLDRFKNGIITDTFVDHSRGDTAHPKYQAAIDPDLGILRASTDQIGMEDSLRVKAGRLQHGYAVNNDIATIALTLFVGSSSLLLPASSTCSPTRSSPTRVFWT